MPSTPVKCIITIISIIVLYCVGVYFLFMQHNIGAVITTSCQTSPPICTDWHKTTHCGNFFINTECCFCPGVTRTTRRHWTRGPSGKAGHPLSYNFYLPNCAHLGTLTFPVKTGFNKRLKLYSLGLYNAAMRHICQIIDPYVNIWQWARVFPIIIMIHHHMNHQ